jgi:serine/threonine-protein kinase
MRERSVDHTERPGADSSDSSRGAVLPPQAADQGIPRGSASFATAGRRTLLKEEAPFLNGKYILKRKLGAGGMSQVWAALEPYSDNVVAIKLLHDQGGNLALRFRQECRFYPKLQHPNIVRMSQAGEDENGTMYIIMDLLKGSTVRRVLTSSRLKIVEALHLAIQLADACAYMHRKGVWHRDLKPENLMVGTKDEWKGHLWLFDFGISKFANLEDGGLNTDELPEVASVRYMAPEQVDGTRRHLVDGRADIYSFGVILYELITGRHTFVKANEPTTAAQIMNGHLVAHVRPIPHIVPDCDEALWDLVKKCLARDPAERFQNFEEIGETLGNIRRTTLPPDHYIAQRVKKDVLRVARSRAFAASEIDSEDHDEPAREGGGDRAPDSAHRRPTAPGVYPAYAQEVALQAAQKSAIARSPRAAEARQRNQPSDDSSVDDVGIETPRVVRLTEPMPLAFHPPAHVLPFGRSIAPQRGGVGDTERLPAAATLRPPPAPAQASHATPPPISGVRSPRTGGDARPTEAPQLEASAVRGSARGVPMVARPATAASASTSGLVSAPPSTTPSIEPTPATVPNEDPANVYGATEPLQGQRGAPPSSLTPISTMSILASPSPSISPLPSRSLAPTPVPAPTRRSSAYAPAVAIGLMVSLLGSGAILVVRGRGVASPAPAATTTIAATDPTTSPTVIAAPQPSADPTAAAPTAEPVNTASPSPSATALPLPTATSVPSVPARVPAPKAKPAPSPAKPAPPPSAPPVFQPLFTLPPEKPKHGSLDLEDNAQPRHAESSGSVRHG